MTAQAKIPLADLVRQNLSESTTALVMHMLPGHIADAAGSNVLQAVSNEDSVIFVITGETLYHAVKRMVVPQHIILETSANDQG